MRLRIVTVVTLATGVLLAPAAPLPVGAQTRPLTDITVTSVGPGAPEWGVYVAEARGFFAREGLHIVTETAGNTQNCVNALVAGDAPIGVLASDVVIVANARNLPIKLIAPLITVDTYMLVVAPSVKTWGDLKGKVVLVTNKEDITAISFRKMAEAQHLDWQKDFTILLSGTSQLRTTALISGNAQGALLAQPFDEFAVAQGMHVLARSADYVKNWISNGLAVNTNWAATHHAEIVHFLRAVRDGTRYAYDHPDDAVTIMAQYSKTDPAQVQKGYDLLFRQLHGMSRDGIIDERSLRNVDDGVVQMGTLPQAVPLSAVLDSSYAKEAAR